MTTNKIKIAIATAAIAGVATYWYFSPYLALHQMHAAAQARDADAFNDFVDYPKLRDSLKGQFSALLATKMPQPSAPADSLEAAGAAFGNMLGLAMVDRMIDAVVRPESVMHAMQKGTLQLQRPTANQAASRNSAAEVDIHMIKQALQLYKMDHGSYPPQNAGLRALIEPSSPGGSGTMTYLEQLPRDPWGRPYQYANPGKIPGTVDVFYQAAVEGQTVPDEETRPPKWASIRKGVNKVIVSVDDADAKQAGPSLVLERMGFASWKLTEVRLPNDAFK